MKSKLKTCSVCGKEKILWKSKPPTCQSCIPRKSVNKISKTHSKTIDEFVIKKRQYLKLNPKCVLRLYRCTQEATVIHHKKGKATRELYLDEKYWAASCFNCNQDVEEIIDPYSLGLKIRRNEKN